MTRSVIGSHVALRYLKAYNAHVSYWHDLNPTVALAYVDKPEHCPYILEYAAAFPNALVVARIQHPADGGFHLAPTGKDDYREYVSSPAVYHAAYGYLGRGENTILNVMNEPSGFADDLTISRLVRWMTDYIPTAAKARTKSLLFNWADRNPKIINGLMDGRFDEVLTMMAHYPDLFYMGMHFYGPDNVAEHIQSYVARCEKLSIKPPKVIGSEFGIDSTGGAQRGYKTRPEYKDGGVYARWQESIVHGELAPYFASGVLVGLAVFQEGNSGGWDDMDIEDDHAYKEEIKRAALAGELQPVVTTQTAPVVIPAPADKGVGVQITLTGTQNWNLRAAADTNATKIGLVKAGESITIYGATVKASGGYSFYYVERAAAPPDESSSGYMAYTQAIPAPPVVTDPPVVVPPIDSNPPVIDPPPAETLFSYSLSLTLRSPVLSADRLRAIENGVKAIVAGMVWLGVGIGTSEIEVKASKSD